MSRVATLLVRRGGAAEAARHDRFEVTFESGQSVLDGLRSVRATSDPTLAFRYACLNANACKECMILLDGKVVYACATWRRRSRRRTSGWADIGRASPERQRSKRCCGRARNDQPARMIISADSSRR
jgi:hypothetical protein